MIAENLGVPVIAELVLLGRRLAVHRFKVGNHELRQVRPVTYGYRLGGDEILERVVLPEHRRGIQITLDRMIERRNISRALYRGVAAERHNAGPGTANVAEQKLQQSTGADDLDAVGVLRPGDRVGKGSRPLRA